MIAVSSHRPFAECPPEIARQQVDAKESWNREFERIVYFGERERHLDSCKTQFHPSEERPQIRSLVEFCALQPGWSCIINADIVLGGNFARAERELKNSRVDCGISRRWELPDDGDMTRARLADYGLDFFAAHCVMWREVAKNVPDEFRLGKILWDTWMLSYFMVATRGNCADLTPARIIFHPKHGDRREQHLQPPKSPYLDRVSWPGFQIGKNWPLTLPKKPMSPRVSGGGGGALA